MKRLSREDRCSQLERDMAWVWVLEWKWAWKYFKGGEDQMIRSSKSDLSLVFGFGEVEMGAATNLSWMPVYRGRTPTMVHYMRFVLEGLENLFLQFSWWNVWRSQIEDSFGFARKLAWRQNHGEAAMFENLSDTWVCVSFQFLVSFDSHLRLHRAFSLTAWEMATSTLKAPHINMITLLRHHTVPYVHAFAWIFLNFSKFLCISMHLSCFTALPANISVAA